MEERENQFGKGNKLTMEQRAFTLSFEFHVGSILTFGRVNLGLLYIGLNHSFSCN